MMKNEEKEDTSIGISIRTSEGVTTSGGPGPSSTGERSPVTDAKRNDPRNDKGNDLNKNINKQLPKLPVGETIKFSGREKKVAKAWRMEGKSEETIRSLILSRRLQMTRKMAPKGVKGEMVPKAVLRKGKVEALELRLSEQLDAEQILLEAEVRGKDAQWQKVLSKKQKREFALKKTLRETLRELGYADAVTQKLLSGLPRVEKRYTGGKPGKPKSKSRQVNVFSQNLAKAKTVSGKVHSDVTLEEKKTGSEPKAILEGGKRKIQTQIPEKPRGKEMVEGRQSPVPSTSTSLTWKELVDETNSSEKRKEIH